MSKAQSRAYAKEQRRLMDDAIEQSRIKADLDVIGAFRHWLIFKRQSQGPRDDLMNAIDDYVGGMTGDRTTLHLKGHSIP